MMFSTSQLAFGATRATKSATAGCVIRVYFLNSEIDCSGKTKSVSVMIGEPTHSEHFLLQELRKGNVKAFEQIFRSYWPELYRIAKSKLQSHDEAEEVIQSVFSTLWEKRKTLVINNLSQYLRVCVRNRILNNIRANIMKERYWEYYRSFLPTETNVTAETVAFDDLDEAIQEAVSSLPEKSRRVFTLSRIEGKTNAEIAHILELSEKAIEYHLTKSVRALKVRLKDFIL